MTNKKDNPIHAVVMYWNAYWFPDASALRLAICRIIVVGAQLCFFLPSLGNQLNKLEKSGGFIEPQLFITAVSAILPDYLIFLPMTFKVIYWATVIAGTLCLIGLFTRSSAFIFAFGNWFLIAHAYSYGEEHHREALLCIFLVFLALSPSGNRLSIDALLKRGSKEARAIACAKEDMAIWPLRLTQLLFGLTYFSTGFSKVVYGGLQWLNGYTLQQYIIVDAALFDRPLGLWLAAQHELCILLSIATIFFELFFFVTLFIPRSIPYFLVAGTLFHVGIYLAMAAPFFQHIFLYSVFIDFERLYRGPQRFRSTFPQNLTENQC